MSTRQNKKRKAKPTRERTVTTLTGADEDDNPLLRPGISFQMSTSVDDPSLAANIMSSPFSIASSSGGGGGVPPAFQPMQSDYPAFTYAQFMNPMQHMSHPQQAQFFPNPSLPPGQSDLEVLERLKETIKNNQHEIFRAFPRPDVLASLYQGPVNPLLSTVPPHPEQALTNVGYQAVSNPVQSQQQALGNPGLSASGSNASVDRTRNGSVSWEANGNQRRASVSSVGGPSPKQAIPPRSDSAVNNKSFPESRNGTDPKSAPPPGTSNSRPDAAPAVVVKPDPDAPPQPGIRDNPLIRVDPKDDRGRDAWYTREEAERRRFDLERSSYPTPRSNAGDVRPPPLSPGGRAGLPRSYDRPRESSRERLRDRDLERDRDRDRDRRFSDWRPRDDDRDRRPLDSPSKRPPGDDKRQDPVSRNYDRRWEPRPDRPPEGDKRPPPPEDRPHRPLPVDRKADERPPPRRPITLPSKYPDPYAPKPGDDGRPPPPPPVEERISRPSGAPPAIETARPVAHPVAEEHVPPRSAVPLEERISRAPSLHERISGAPPVTTRAEEPPARAPGRPGPSLEERLSRPADVRNAPAVTSGGQRASDDVVRPRPPEPARPLPPRDRADERVHRAPPMPPPPNAGRERFGNGIDDRPRASYTRAPSIAREDPRPAPPPPHRAPTPGLISSARATAAAAAHDFRPRELSRERNADYRPYHRAEYDRPPLDEDKRSDHLGPPDAGSRYDDSRPPPSASYRRYHPDDRGRPYTPPPGSPTRSDPYIADADRRRERDRERDRDRDGREWYPRSSYGGPADDHRSPYWDDRDRAPPPRSASSWDRDGFRDPPFSSSSARFDDRDRDRDRPRDPPPSVREPYYPPYEGSRPPLSARLTDSYSGYPPPSSTRSAYGDAPLAGRVRPHSRSPPPRDRDDMRPFKRARDDAYEGGGRYYSPPGLEVMRKTTPLPTPPVSAKGILEYPPPRPPPGTREYEDALFRERELYPASMYRPSPEPFERRKVVDRMDGNWPV